MWARHDDRTARLLTETKLHLAKACSGSVVARSVSVSAADLRLMLFEKPVAVGIL